ncbi:hypothetical protein ABID82_007227 [Methylobacterium sp. PvP062]|uniref:Uncharacterized protein n=1 Tax=Methylobacterium radiotolerans TaxID=31998 RepID=A0ABV2NRU5_9HYPH|nr:hypothetical protein [Methylobacterium sp. PvP105]MBP2499590.1 hypothetical protein [Methylobacterium sp. PvP109]
MRASETLKGCTWIGAFPQRKMVMVSVFQFRRLTL